MRRFSIGLILLAAGCVTRSEASPLPAAMQHPAQRAAQAAAPAGGATLSGRVTWHGAHPAMPATPIPANASACGTESPFQALHIGADEGVSGAVITVEGAQGTASPSTVTIDQHACEFEPHVVVVPVGGHVNFTNHDSVLHSVHAFRGAASDFNLATPPGLALARPMEAPGVLRLQCDVGHTWMSGWIHVVNSPFAVTTDSHGAYHIPHLPPGTYRVTMWHEGWQSQGATAGRPNFAAPVTHTESVTVPATGTVEHNFTLP